MATPKIIYETDFGFAVAGLSVTDPGISDPR
jgi:hypothetical protein